MNTHPQGPYVSSQRKQSNLMQLMDSLGVKEHSKIKKIKSSAAKMSVATGIGVGLGHLDQDCPVWGIPQTTRLPKIKETPVNDKRTKLAGRNLQTSNDQHSDSQGTVATHSDSPHQTRKSQASQPHHNYQPEPAMRTTHFKINTMSLGKSGMKLPPLTERLGDRLRSEGRCPPEVDDSFRNKRSSVSKAVKVAIPKSKKLPFEVFFQKPKPNNSGKEMKHCVAAHRNRMTPQLRIEHQLHTHRTSFDQLPLWETMIGEDPINELNISGISQVDGFDGPKLSLVSKESSQFIERLLQEV